MKTAVCNFILKVIFNYQLESFILKSPWFVRNVQMQNYLGNDLVPTFILEEAWKAFGQIFTWRLVQDFSELVIQLSREDYKTNTDF